ncbi:hypothetical protein [Sphingomonas sp. ID0503]|jgi:hypothetical protein|uniref:hypothetical protein n=1 Tax=Sphingomonas sp. ID0503 TaxID=3399691 RepID=UPI003AFA3188
MTYPIDQIVALAKANGQLALKFAEIARTAGEQYLQVGSKATAALADQVKDAKPGAVPSFNSEEATNLLAEIEKNRQAALTEARTALTQWQDSYRTLFADASSQQELMNSARALFEPFFRLSAATTDGRAAPGEAPTRTGK